MFGIYVIIVTVIIPMAIDPYNIFHKADIRENGVEPNKNYIKMCYVLENPDKFDSFLFGSSRVGAIHTENMKGVKCYNMTYSAGTPKEHLQNLNTLVSHGIIPDRVYIGLDSMSYTEDYREHTTQLYRSPYEYSESNPTEFYSMYLNPFITLYSLVTTMKFKNTKEDNTVFYEYGWWCEYFKGGEADWTDVDPQIGNSNCMDDTLNTMSELVEFCHNEQIELVVFTNPMYEVTYRASVERDYLVFLEKLAQITSFYNFSGINDITTDTVNFADPGHYNAYVGDMMIECMCNHKNYEGLYEQGFGMYVSKENIDEFIQIIGDI